jgi:hypothetical protein
LTKRVFFDVNSVQIEAFDSTGRIWQNFDENPLQEDGWSLRRIIRKARRTIFISNPLFFLLRSQKGFVHSAREMKG